MKSILHSASLALSISAGAVGAPVPPPAPLAPLPNAAQMRWHKAEYIMFAHFGMKTFHPSGNHMGTGDEDPKTFNPPKLNTDQWVEAAKTGGFKGIVLTTKHHDGFCNWRTDTTGHDIASAAWKDGKGDVVKDLAESCRKGGVYFGLYVSIIDAHFNKYGSPKHKSYGDYYFDQLKELSTRYGKVDEYWFDGYNASNLKMDYPGIGRMIAETQPDAVVYDSGMLVKTIPDRCVAWPGHHGGLTPDQNYIQKINGVDAWYPNEASIILQGNWFHVGRPSVSVRQMQDLYLTSTGVGSTPLMNIPPNAEGEIDAEVIVKLKEFKAWVDTLHDKNLARAKGVAVTDDGRRGNSPQYAADKVVDGDYDTYFSPDDGKTTAVIEVKLPENQKIGGIMIQEYIPLGQRVDGYAIDCRVNGKWEEVFTGKKIGYKRIILEGRSAAPAGTFNEGNIDVLKLKDAPMKDDKIRFPVADAVRLRITDAKACPLINNFQIIGVMDPRASWKLHSKSFEAPGGEASKALDQNPGTIWYTHGPDGESGLPQEFSVDMGYEKSLKGFTYLPRQDGTVNGMVDQYAFAVSTDGKEWKTVAEGEFGNLRANTAEQTVSFAAVKARYFRFTAKHALESNHAVVAEIGVVE
jgi:alpha-L-fucosidase